MAMKKNSLAALLLMLSIPCLAQGGLYAGQTQLKAAHNVLLACPHATVRIGTAASSGTPLSPLAAIYTDPTLATPRSNPFLADARGAYFVYAPSGFYKQQIKCGTSTYTEPFQITAANPIISNPPASAAQSINGPLNLSTFGLTAATVTASNLGGFFYVDGTIYPTVQAAITAACAAGGGTVYIPPGIYPQNSSFTLCRNLNLIGAGRAQSDAGPCPTTITTTLASGDLFPITAMNMIHISDFCIKNTGSAGANAVFRLNWGQFIIAERLYIQGPFAVGIQLNPAIGVASTIYNMFRDIHMTGLPPNGIGCLLDSGASTDQVVNNNYFDNVDCMGGINGVGLKTAGGSGGVPVVNENVFNGGQFVATNGTAVLISGGTFGSTRDLTIIGGDIEGSAIGLNIQGKNDGIRCIGCNISANATNVVTSGPQARNFITGNIGGAPQFFSVDQNGNLNANSLCFGAASCLTGSINGNGSGWGLLAGGNTVANILVSGFQLNKDLDANGNSVAGAASLSMGAVTFSHLGTPANGTIRYCSDCKTTSACASGGSGAIAKRLNGGWVCN